MEKNQVFLAQTEDIIKLRIYTNREKLESLSMKVVRQCGVLVHHREDATGVSDLYDSPFIQNIRSELLQTIETNDPFSPDNNLFRVTYDEYMPPAIYSVMREFLRDDYRHIAKVFDKENPGVQTKFSNYDTQIQNFMRQYLTFTGTTEEKIRLLRECEQVIQEYIHDFRNTTLPKEPVENYREAVLDCLSFEKLGIIPKYMFENVAMFSGIEMSPIIVSGELNSYLQKKKVL